MFRQRDEGGGREGGFNFLPGATKGVVSLSQSQGIGAANSCVEEGSRKSGAY